MPSLTRIVKVRKLIDYVFKFEKRFFFARLRVGASLIPTRYCLGPSAEKVGYFNVLQIRLNTDGFEFACNGTGHRLVQFLTRRCVIISAFREWLAAVVA